MQKRKDFIHGKPKTSLLIIATSADAPAEVAILKL
jgi:hypothetical protein